MYTKPKLNMLFIKKPYFYWIFIYFTVTIKVTGIRPIAPVLNKVHLKVSEHEILSFSVRKEIIKNNNSLVK